MVFWYNHSEELYFNLFINCIYGDSDDCTKIIFHKIALLRVACPPFGWSIDFGKKISKEDYICFQEKLQNMDM